MAFLKKLNWLKYLFVDKAEAETEQEYWDTKRKKHMSKEHSAGIAEGLQVTEDSPPSLEVVVAAGRCVDSNGDDPEIETPEMVDCSGLVPDVGFQTVYIVFEYTSAETDPYYVPEIGGSQNKYTQDGYTLVATLTPPVAPKIELARIALTNYVTEITDPVNPASPVYDEIDSTHRVYTGKEVLLLRDLTDVSVEEADAFNAMASPSASNPVATIDDVDVVGDEVVAARGSVVSLDTRLDVMLNENGSFKGITQISPSSPLTGGGTSGNVAVEIPAAAGPATNGYMLGSDKAKLDGSITQISPSSPLTGGGTSGNVAVGLPLATPSADGAMSAADKTRLDLLRDYRASHGMRFYDEFLGYSLTDGEIGSLHWNKDTIGGADCTLSWGHAGAGWAAGTCGSLKMATPAVIGQGTHLRAGAEGGFHAVRGWRYVVGFFIGSYPFIEGKVLLGFYKSNTGDTTPPDGIWLEIDSGVSQAGIRGVVANAGVEDRTVEMHSIAALGEFVQAEFEIYDDGGTRKVRFRVNEGSWEILSDPDLPDEITVNELCCGIYTKDGDSKELYVDYVDAWCEFGPRHE